MVILPAVTKHIITNYFYIITDFLYIISKCLSTFGSYDLLASKSHNCNCVEIMTNYAEIISNCVEIINKDVNITVILPLVLLPTAYLRPKYIITFMTRDNYTTI